MLLKSSRGKRVNAKYRKDWMQTEGAYSIWKKGWQADGWTPDGSTLDKIRWLCQQQS